MVNAQFIAMSGELTISSSGRFAAIRPVAPVENRGGTHHDKRKQFAGDHAGGRRDGAARVAACSDAADALLSDRGQRLARLRVMAQVLGQSAPAPALNGGSNHPSPALTRFIRQYQPATTPPSGPVCGLYL